MFYRVVQSKNDQSAFYDFDDIEDAREWISQELSFDINSDKPIGYSYSICEVLDEVGKD